MEYYIRVFNKSQFHKRNRICRLHFSNHFAIIAYNGFSWRHFKDVCIISISSFVQRFIWKLSNEWRSCNTLTRKIGNWRYQSFLQDMDADENLLVVNLYPEKVNFMCQNRNYLHHSFVLWRGVYHRKLVEKL